MSSQLYGDLKANSFRQSRHCISSAESFQRPCGLGTQHFAHATLTCKGPRALIDRKLYKKYMRQELDAVENLTLLEGSVADLLITAPDPEFGETKSYGRIQGIALGRFL